MTAPPLQECKQQLARLAIGSTPIKEIARRAARMVEGYWNRLSAGDRTELRQWLITVHADSGRIVERSAMKEKIRQAEMAIGGLEALERKASERR